MSMSKTLSRTVPIMALLAFAAAPAAAQTSSVMTDLMRAVGEVEEKLVGLARSMPDASYDWRPGEGVRSVGEVFKHVAADNYLIPAAVGYPAPEATGIDASDWRSAGAYEARAMTKDQVVAALAASFAHLREVMREAGMKDMGEEVMLFGTRSTSQQVWILTTTHLHEHLGQSIAYARSNGVVPPWSN